jgi:short-subunit dehydrogenase
MALPPPQPDSTCLVTGASSGIGEHIARELARRGHGVTLVARRADRLAELAEELTESHGIRAETVGCDLNDADGRQSMMDEVAGHGLTVEVLVNNAGFGSGGAFHELDLEGETGMVRTNVEVVVALTGAYLPGMVQRRRGAVLNLASLIAFQPVPYQATYGASKAFVLAFSEAVHEELRGTGVTITALCPGPVRTEFGASGGFGGADDNIPEPVWINPGEVAAAGVEGVEKGRRVVVPGRLNQIGAIGGRLTPRSVLLPLVSRFWPVS